jgi:hypothetical protein
MFKPVNLESKEELVKFLNAYKSISCEMCFGNLFVWSDFENTEYYISENVLYLRSGKYGYYFPVFYQPPLDYKQAVQNILSFEKNIKFINLLKEQAEFLKDNFNFKITERRDKSEYIYEADKLRTFSGRKLHGKKNHLNRFYALYGNRYEYENIDEHNIRECLKFSWKWRNLNEVYMNDSILTELDMVKKFIENYDNLDLSGGCIKIDGEIKAFTIGERAFAGSDCVIIHIEKADYDEVQGIYPAICSAFLNSHPEFNFVNREDDLGDEGLRRSKLSYRPVYLLDRFEAEV